MAEVKPVAIGVIGCGHVTERHHLPTLMALPEARVVALADIDVERVTKLGDQFAIGKRYMNYKQLLADPEIEAVAVLVPPQFHVPVAMDALSAGKHLFVEKPLSNSLAGTTQLIACAQKVKVQSQLGFMLRSHRLVRKARDIVRSGDLGIIELIRTVWTGGPAHRLTKPDWLEHQKNGGGVLIESGVHHYDMWRFLLDDEVVEVSARAMHQPVEEAAATVNGRMASGALASSVFSRGTSDSHEIEIFGTKGRVRVSAYRVDGLEVQHLHDLSGGMKARVARTVKSIREFPAAWRLSRSGGVFNEAYKTEWSGFLDCIRKGADPICTLEDGRRALAVAIAATESDATRRPVTIDDTYFRESEAVAHLAQI
ncbi:MAG TPA: Gfo/Idh/MocA family oxidoreductase [Phycisphaerae bacterium]|jgi:predicted dehydrogenase|nr:Gfo/Idh/MocA family oxidoreductase [Phycisphaerae bacterium]